MNSFKESIPAYVINSLGVVLRALPLTASLWIGRMAGKLFYYFGQKQKRQTYTNLRMAFADSKSAKEIRRITQEVFMNYGQNFVELFRMPLLTPKKFEELVTIEGRENIIESLKQNKGVILLAMHFGSWEMASASCAMLGHPYKMIVKTQTRNTKLDDLLNSYRECGGSVVLTRGMGTRDLIRSLQNNEIIGMVVDQGGKEGALVPFFGRPASLSVGAVRLGLKWGVPLCFSVIFREKDAYHRMIINKPLELIKTEDPESDVIENLKQITKIMERYICEHPSEYMWFYKIWKYSNESQILILSDGRTGHLRQSQPVARMLQSALMDREITSTVKIIKIAYKNPFLYKIFAALSLIVPSLFHHGRQGLLKLFLTKESYEQITSLKIGYLISCGSSMAALNHLLSVEQNAKSIAILKPGLLNLNRFDLVILPQHDAGGRLPEKRLAITKGAPNLITPEYLKDQSALLLSRYTHLKTKVKTKIGVFIGGEAKNILITEHQIRILIQQLKDVSQQINADILLTTSRRTPARIEQLLFKELKKFSQCSLLVLANQENVPEAVGGILGLADIVIVSGDSISMISEAASSGKNTIVFMPQERGKILKFGYKHRLFIEKLNSQGYIAATHVRDVGHTVLSVVKQKIQTRRIEDNDTILDAVRLVI